MAYITLSHGNARDLAPAAVPAIVKDMHRAAGEALWLVARLGLAIARHWRDQQDIHWLADADDAVLRDLGIARSDIPRLVRTGRR